MFKILFRSLKSATSKTYGIYNLVVGTFTNMRANGYQVENITMTTTYGVGGIPPDGLSGLLIPIEGSNKSYVCAGFGQVIPNINYSFNSGESWLTSAPYFTNPGYTLIMQSSGVIVYRIINPNHLPFYATLPSGEWMNKILGDLLNDNNSVLRDYINNTIVSIFNAHTHIAPSGGGATSAPTAPNTMTNIPNSTTLPDDATAVSNKNTLINDSGTVPS